MYHVVTDLKGNTPLLQAVLPTVNQTRENILLTLNQRTAAGTLVVKKSAGIPTVLRGQLPGENSLFKFAQVSANQDLNFGCDLLGITREELVATLESLQSAEEFPRIREKIARDMVEQFVSKEFNINPKLKIPLLQRYMEALHLLESKTRLINETLKGSLSRVVDYSAKEILELEADDQIELNTRTVMKLRECLENVEKYHSKLLTYCSTDESYFWYLKQLLVPSLRIGINSITLYAYAHNLPFCVWENKASDLTLLAKTLQQDTQRKTIHLLSLDGYFNYQLLHKFDVSKLDEYSCVFSLEKQFDPLTEINADHQNLLHLAAQSEFCDVLVPHLLYGCNFDTRVNAVDIHRNTALHLAVRYFLGTQEVLLLCLEGSEFYRLIATCFTALLMAGSDLTLKNENEQNVLQLAGAFEEQNVDSEFKATAWLSSLNFCCPQKIVSNPAINPDSQPIQTDFFSSVVSVGSEGQEVAKLSGKRAAATAEQLLRRSPRQRSVISRSNT